MPIVWVPVANLDRAKKFYVDKVGMRLRQDIQIDFAEPRARRVLVAPEGSREPIGLMESESPGTTVLVLATDDLMADYDRLLTKGVEFERPPKDEPWGVDAVFRDPDGNRLILRQQNALL